MLDAKSLRIVAEQTSQETWRVVIVIDPDAPGDRLEGDLVAGWEPEGPTSPQLWPVAETTDLGRVSQVTDETDLSPDGAESTAEIEAAMAEARARLAEVPAEVVVVNHIMGLYELGAIHLSSETPDLVAAQLAIDSMALLVEGLGPRLGDDAQTMADALANIRMAFVSVKAQTGQSAANDD